MNEYVKLSIKGRKDIFSNNYEIKNKDILDKIEDLFKRIEDFGKNFSDAMEFEQSFMASPLNEEYNNLLSEVASKCKFIMPDEFKEELKEDMKRQAKEDIKSEAKYILEDLSMPARRKAREELDSKLRDTPLGTLEQISNMKHLFNRFKKK